MDNLSKEILTFNELPEIVRGKFWEVISKRLPSEDTDGSTFFNLGDVPVEFNTVTMTSGFGSTLKNGGMFFEFKIRNKVLKLDGNLGKPFVIYAHCLYYPNEFNTGGEEYKNVKYIKINFESLIK